MTRIMSAVNVKPPRLPRAVVQPEVTKVSQFSISLVSGLDACVVKYFIISIKCLKLVYCFDFW